MDHLLLFAVLDRSNNHIDYDYTIWVLGNYGVEESWTKLCHIDHCLLQHIERPLGLFWIVRGIFQAKIIWATNSIHMRIKLLQKILWEQGNYTVNKPSLSLLSLHLEIEGTRPLIFKRGNLELQQQLFIGSTNGRLPCMEMKETNPILHRDTWQSLTTQADCRKKIIRRREIEVKERLFHSTSLFSRSFLFFSFYEKSSSLASEFQCRWPSPAWSLTLVSFDR